MAPRPKILLVDDEHTLLRTLTIILQRAGYDVVCAESGEQAIALAAQHSPDLLLSDIRMPGISGVEAAAEIVKLVPACRVFFLSAYASSLPSRHSLKFDVAAKPVHPAELLRRLAAALQAAEHAPTILYVDDDAIQRYALVRVLTAAGYRVIEAATAEAGVRAFSQRPDAVLLDIGLPDALGFDVHSALNRLPTAAGIPVIYVTSRFRDEQSQRRAMELGAVGYFSLPFEPELLCSLLQRQLKKAPGQSENEISTTA